MPFESIKSPARAWIREVSGVVIVVGACLLVLSLCGCNSDLTVTREALKVTTRYLEDEKDRSKIPLKPDEEAVTKWKFGCKTEFDFDIVDQTFLDDEYMATLKIKSVRMKLDAPVTIWIPKNADEELREHENSHVLICQKVYDRSAEKKAAAAARGVIGKEFQATGQTLEKACSKALSMASVEICQPYHVQIVEEINRVSEIFDGLDHQHKGKEMPELVDMAFSSYNEVK